MENTRQHPRHDISVSVEVFHQDQLLLADGNNLSQGGIGITLDVPLPEKVIIGLSMFLTEDDIEEEKTEPLNVHAQIIWCTEQQPSGFVAGLRFVDLDAAQSQKLKLFLWRLTHG